MLEHLGSPDSETRDKAWFDVWSALCHQTDVYTATYAAAPEIVLLAAATVPSGRWPFFHFLAYAEACRNKKVSPEIPQELDANYWQALTDAATLASENLSEMEDDWQFTCGLAILAAADGRPRLAAALVELYDETDCPNCDTSFQTRGYDLLQE